MSDTNTIWKTIQRTLEQNNIKTFPPATKIGECRSEYVVLKQAGSAQINLYSSEFVYYQFMLYVPHNKYHTLDDFERRVKQVLNSLYPLIRSSGSNNPDYYDDEIKAHMRSFTYKNARRNKFI